ncbi:MAG: hypothetical protein GJT30_14245 [Geobacter sp.]|nr:hypothetical protein [Geobacter sp.]
MKYIKLLILTVFVLVVIILGIVLSRCIAKYDVKDKNHIVLIQGKMLYLYSGRTYKEIKRAPIFYGCGWIDSKTVFYVYQPNGYAEAIAKVAIVDVTSFSTNIIATIGGAGESNFDGNLMNHAIVFNKFDGVYVLKAASDKYVINKLNSDANVVGVFWIDSETIGYQRYTHNKGEFVKIKYR